MNAEAQHKGQTQNPKDLSPFARLFALLERLAYRHAVLVLIVSVLLAVLSAWVTLEKLTFKTGRSDLVAKDLPYVQRHEAFREEFPDFDGMVIVVEDDDPERQKAFAEALVEKFKLHPDAFSEIFYKIDTSHFKTRALLYLNEEDIVELGEKIRGHREFLDSVNAAPGLNQLLKSINSEISSGMVDTLMGDFLGTGAEKKDDTQDLSLLIALLKQMDAHLKGDARYRSPWSSFFSDEEPTLKQEGYLTSGDGELLFILITPREDKAVFTGYKQSVEYARGLIEEAKAAFPGIRVGITGEDVIASDEMVTTQVDVQKASFIALAGVSILFIVAFRGLVKPLMAVFCLIVALCWSMGFTTLTVGHLNILSVVFTTILIGLGIDFGIHILERFKEERQAGRDTRTALGITLQGTGRGNFAGAVTTAIAFGAMALTDFIGIAELGWIAGGGILLCMLAMVLLLPSLVVLEERGRKTRYDANARTADKKKWLAGFYRHHRAIIVVCLALFGAAAFTLKDVRFDYNLLNLQAKNTEAVRYELKILDKAGRSAWSAALIADSLEDARKIHKAAKKLSTVSAVESVVSLIPENQQEKIETIQTLAPELKALDVAEEDEPVFVGSLKRTLKRIGFKLRSKEEEDPKDAVAEAGRWVQTVRETLKEVDADTAEQRLTGFNQRLFADYREKMGDLKANAEPSPVTLQNVPQELKKRMVSANGRFMISVYPAVDIWDIEQREAFLRELRGIDPGAVGNAVHMFESSRLMKEGYVTGGLYAFTAILLFVLILFRNPRTAALIFLPVLVGFVWTLGLMHLIELRFNFANLVILPLILGIGVVNGIHIIHRFREEGNPADAVLPKSTGLSVILSALTTIAGFGSMMVADHQGIFSLGLVLSIGVGCCMLASITLLPALLKLMALRGWKI